MERVHPGARCILSISKPQPFAHVVRGALRCRRQRRTSIASKARTQQKITRCSGMLPGDETHARKAIEIFDAWSGTLCGFFRERCHACWPAGRAASSRICRDSARGTSSGMEPPFAGAVQALCCSRCMCRCCGCSIRRANGNWDAAIMYSLLAIGVFCEDRNLMESVYRHFSHWPREQRHQRVTFTPSGNARNPAGTRGTRSSGLPTLRTPA